MIRDNVDQEPSSRINPALKCFAARILPRWLLDLLDPFQKIIDTEVRWIAAQIRTGDIVLDAGAGEGRHRAGFSMGTYLALDSRVGDRAWDYSGLDICGDLESLPLRTGSVNAILCMVVLEHTRNPRLVLEEFARVLKPGGSCVLVVPFLWEEHQPPHDYFRFTRYGIQSLFETLPLKINLLEPAGGFFRLCARRCVNLLGFFQGSWRWLLFLILAPFFGLLFPLLLSALDRLDRSKHFTLGFRVRTTREEQ